MTQRQDALVRANEIRSARAKLKLDLKTGHTQIYELLLEPPDIVHTMKVFDLMMATPKYGRVKVNKVFVKCRMSPSKTIGGMSLRQRTEIVSILRPQ